MKDAARHTEGVISAEMTTTLKGFAAEAAQSDMYEVAAAKIARERSSNAEVKAFAAKMIAAHTETSRKLKALLAAEKTGITPPATLDDRHQGLIDELRGAKTADFDGRYIAQQVDAHKEALILMNGYAKDGDAARHQEIRREDGPGGAVAPEYGRAYGEVDDVTFRLRYPNDAPGRPARRVRV